MKARRACPCYNAPVAGSPRRWFESCGGAEDRAHQEEESQETRRPVGWGMCGICGFLDLQGRRVDESIGHRMTDLLWHRGPEAEGVLVRHSPAPGDPSIFLGH